MADKPILVLSYSDLARDPRVDRQIRSLVSHYPLVCVGLGKPLVPEVEFVPLPPYRKTLLGQLSSALRLGARFFETYYWGQAWVRAAQQAVAGRSYSLVLANDLNTLPLALKLAGKAPVVCDLHEYFPLEYEDKLSFRLFFQKYNTYLCRRYLPRCAGLMTVCQGIAERYAAEFGVPEPAVIYNAPDYALLEPSPVSADGRVRLLHHGTAVPSRHLELMVDVVSRLDKRFTLDFYLIAHDPGYLARLQQRAGGDPRITFHPPVAMRDLPAIGQGYDVGLYLLPAVSFNNRHALPNKFFEFIQSRLAIAIGPSPEMARIVRTHDLGLVAEDFTPAALAAKLQAITSADLDRFKRNAHAAARLYSAETVQSEVAKAIKSALGK